MGGGLGLSAAVAAGTIRGADVTNTIILGIPVCEKNELKAQKEERKLSQLVRRHLMWPQRSVPDARPPLSLEDVGVGQEQGCTFEQGRPVSLPPPSLQEKSVILITAWPGAQRGNEAKAVIQK